MELLEIISLNWPAAICLLAGFILVTIELFTPGFGVPGISGLALLLIGVVVASDSLLEGILLTIIIVLMLCLLFTIAVRSASKGALAKTPLVLKTSTDKEDGFTSGEDMAYFLGHEGVAATMLRPVGTADFDGVKLEVLAEGEFIEAGKPVTMVNLDSDAIERTVTITPTKVKKLLVPHVLNGQLAIELPSIAEKKAYIAKQLTEETWESELRLECPHKHYVNMTPAVAECRSKMYAELHGGKV